MTNARTIINQAARKIGVVGRGQALSAEEATDALEALNDILSTFSAETGPIYAITSETFSLTGATSYTIGSGGNFNTARPVDITSLYITSGDTDYTVDQISQAEYAGIGSKDTVGIAQVFYYQNNAPLGTIYLYPAPAAGYSVTIASRKAITTFANLTTDYDMPEGFKSMLVYALAVHLSPEYEKPVTMDLLRMARETKQAVETSIRRNNYPTSEVDVSVMGGESFNIYTGDF